MDDQENAVLDKLGEAWNEFVKLEVLHHADREEFMRAIHAAQNIVLARAGLRALGIKRLEQDVRVKEIPNV